MILFLLKCVDAFLSIFDIYNPCLLTWIKCRFPICWLSLTWLLFWQRVPLIRLSCSLTPIFLAFFGGMVWYPLQVLIVTLMETKAPPPLSAYATSCLGARVCVFLSFPSSWDELILFLSVSYVTTRPLMCVPINVRTSRRMLELPHYC